jgi:hypothetical protein
MINEEQKNKFHEIGANNNKAIVDAAKNGDLETVKYLATTEFERSFIRVSDSAKQSAFVTASGGGHLDILKYFLRREFRRSILLKVTAPQALRHAIQEGKIEVAQYLLTTFETKKHIDIPTNTEFYFKLAPLHMLNYLVYDYKMDISPYINRLRKDSVILRDKPYLINFLDCYELKKELGNNGIKEKKLKI